MRRLFPMLGALGLLSIACADAGPEPYNRPCETDAQCGEGEVCFEDGCGPTSTYAVQVTPNSPSYVLQDFNPVSVHNNRMDLVLKGHGTLEGRVMLRERGTTSEYTRSETTIRARGKSANIPGLSIGQPIVYTVKPADPSPSALFSIAVPPGVWDLSATAAVDPNDTLARLLPPVFSQRTVASGQVVDPVLALNADDLVKIEGTLVKVAGQAWALPAPKFLFQARDPADDRALSQIVSFSADKPFTVWARRTSGDIILKVSPDASTGVFAPTMEFSVDPYGPFPIELELGDYGDAVDISGIVQDMDGAPIVGADVKLEGRVRGGGWFSTTAKTVASPAGTYTARVLPSLTSYTVTAVPPAESASFEGSVMTAVVAATALPTVTCPDKYLLTGRVTGTIGGQQNRPVPSVIIDVASYPQPGTRVPQVQTDVNGRFSVRVGPGDYRVTARPSYERKLPWGTRLVTVMGSTDLTIALSEAREVIGTLTSTSSSGASTSIPNALVTVYRAPSTAEIGEDPPPPAKLYEALTDATGQFRLVLPGAATTASTGSADAGLTYQEPQLPDGGSDPYDPYGTNTAAGCGCGATSAGAPLVGLGLALVIALRRERRA